MQSSNPATKPLVGIIMGSTSDWETLESAAQTLDKLKVAYEVRVVSAHRTPDLLFEYAAGSRARGLEVLIAGAGGAAHLPGMTAAKTTLPVLGVPVQSKSLGGLDSLLSIVQMPAGVPVATFAIGTAGAANAGGLYNLGSGEANTWLTLTRAIFAAPGREPKIDFIDMPEVLRGKYQYYTKADIAKLRGAGYARTMTPLADAVKDYVQNYLVPQKKLGE